MLSHQEAVPIPLGSMGAPSVAHHHPETVNTNPASTLQLPPAIDEVSRLRPVEIAPFLAPGIYIIRSHIIVFRDL